MLLYVGWFPTCFFCVYEWDTPFCCFFLCGQHLNPFCFSDIYIHTHEGTHIYIDMHVNTYIYMFFLLVTVSCLRLRVRVFFFPGASAHCITLQHTLVQYNTVYHTATEWKLWEYFPLFPGVCFCVCEGVFVLFFILQMRMYTHDMHNHKRAWTWWRT
jgi:hypothetical protein